MKRWFTPRGLWSLFLMCAFPLHIWTIILAFSDISWVADRTDMWDAVGVVSYGLVYALVESVAVFFVAFLLGFLVSPRWDETRRIVLLSTVVFVASLWAMAVSLYFMFSVTLPPSFIHFLVQSGHPLRYLYAVLLALVIVSFVVPVYLILKSDKVSRSLSEAIGRLGLLTQFYLVLDALGLVIVIIRNI